MPHISFSLRLWTINNTFYYCIIYSNQKCIVKLKPLLNWNLTHASRSTPFLFLYPPPYDVCVTNYWFYFRLCSYTYTTSDGTNIFLLENRTALGYLDHLLTWKINQFEFRIENNFKNIKSNLFGASCGILKRFR